MNRKQRIAAKLGMDLIRRSGYPIQRVEALNLVQTIASRTKTAYSLNAGRVPLAQARAYFEDVLSKAGRDLNEVYPDFDRNYTLLQNKVKAAPAIPRIQMPVIEPQDMGKFQEALNSGRVDIFAPFLKGKRWAPKNLGSGAAGEWLQAGVLDGNPRDDVVGARLGSIAVGKLKPTQDQIWLEKLAAGAAKFGAVKSGSPVTTLTIIVSKEGYILDGHHRFGGAILADPGIGMKALMIPLDIKTLLEIGFTYGIAIGNTPKA